MEVLPIISRCIHDFYEEASMRNIFHIDLLYIKKMPLLKWHIVEAAFFNFWKENEMKVWLDLISTDYGLMSFIVIVAMVIAMLGFAYFVYHHLRK